MEDAPSAVLASLLRPCTTCLEAIPQSRVPGRLVAPLRLYPRDLSHLLQRRVGASTTARSALASAVVRTAACAEAAPAGRAGRRPLAVWIGTDRSDTNRMGKYQNHIRLLSNLPVLIHQVRRTLSNQPRKT